jgi:hypothetical protein
MTLIRNDRRLIAVACLTSLACTAGLRIPAAATCRREAIASFCGAGVLFHPMIAHAAKQAMATGPPLTLLQGGREQLKLAPPLLEEQQWDDLRRLLKSEPLGSLRDASKAVAITAEARALRKTLLDAIFEIESFAYGEQKKVWSDPGRYSLLGTGCIPARYPRDGLPSCFIDDISTPVAALKRAEAALDAILTLSDSE